MGCMKVNQSYLTILLVEDDPDMRDAFEFTLRRLGHNVVSFECGDEAFAWLQQDLPEVAVLDMMLPRTSGFMLAQTIKERSGGSVPVIMMSGNTSPAHRDYAFASGADKFLAKPFSTTALLESIRAVCPPCDPHNSPAVTGSGRVSMGQTER